MITIVAKPEDLSPDAPIGTARLVKYPPGPLPGLSSPTLLHRIYVKLARGWVAGKDLIYHEAVLVTPALNETGADWDMVTKLVLGRAALGRPVDAPVD